MIHEEHNDNDKNCWTEFQQLKAAKKKTSHFIQ